MVSDVVLQTALCNSQTKDHHMVIGANQTAKRYPSADGNKTLPLKNGTICNSPIDQLAQTIPKITSQKQHQTPAVSKPNSVYTFLQEKRRISSYLRICFRNCWL